MSCYHKRIKILTLISMTLVGFASILIIIAFNKKVHLVCGATDVEFSTTFNDTNKILEQINFHLDNDDKVIRDDVNSDISIVINRSFNVPVKINDRIYKVRVNGGCVADVIEKLGIPISELSLIIPPPDTEINIGSSVKIIERKKINVTVDGESKDVLVPVGSLKDALKSIKVELGEYDIINHNIDENVYENMGVKIDRVLYIYVTEVRSIPFKTKFLNHDDDNSIVIPGATGREDITFRQKLINGNVVSKVEIDRCIIEKPVDEVRKDKKNNRGQDTVQKPIENKRPSIHMSADGVIRDQNGKSIKYSKKIVGECTAYTANPSDLTSTGAHPRVGLVAVNPNIIPYGTKMYICSEDGSLIYGYAQAADTGGALMSGRVLVDLFYNTEEECYKFGRRNMAVYILCD